MLQLDRIYPRCISDQFVSEQKSFAAGLETVGFLLQRFWWLFLTCDCRFWISCRSCPPTLRKFPPNSYCCWTNIFAIPIARSLNDFRLLSLMAPLSTMDWYLIGHHWRQLEEFEVLPELPVVVIVGLAYRSVERYELVGWRCCWISDWRRCRCWMSLHSSTSLGLEIFSLVLETLTHFGK